jgi:hypothetical protein
LGIEELEVFSTGRMVSNRITTIKGMPEIEAAIQAAVTPLARIVKGDWIEVPPIPIPDTEGWSDDAALSFIPHFSGKHCLDCIVESDTANINGHHAVSICLLRQVIEALGVMTISISSLPDHISILRKWKNDKLTAGEIRRILEDQIWRCFPVSGLWGEDWATFFKNISRAVQPYAHFTSGLMNWHWVVISDAPPYMVAAGPSDTHYDEAKALRVRTLEGIITWCMGTIIAVSKSAQEDSLVALSTSLAKLKQVLLSLETTWPRGNWPAHLAPFEFRKQRPKR